MSTYFVEVYNSIQPKNRAQKEVLAITEYNQHIINSNEDKEKFITAINTFVKEINARNPRCADLNISRIDRFENEVLAIQDLCRITFNVIFGTAEWNQERINQKMEEK